LLIEGASSDHGPAPLCQRGNRQINLSPPAPRWSTSPGRQFRFAKADKAQVPTRGRVLDHFGLDVKDLHAAIARLEGMGIKIDEPYRKGPTGNAVTYITDPWGARIELVERAPLI
jgi:catechol 2,3-dioxygenase-like lactoylglutathione lyase family enzyme